VVTKSDHEILTPLASVAQDTKQGSSNSVDKNFVTLGQGGFIDSDVQTRNRLLEFKEKLSVSSNIFIISHEKPDADALGSSLGLYSILKSLGKNCYIFNQDIINEDFSFLHAINEINNCNFDILANAKESSLLIYCDCGVKKRIGTKFDFASLDKIYSVNIDHHISNSFFSDINIVANDASSTSELIFYLAKFFDWPLSKDVCTSLYTGIVGDTGFFRYSCTTQNTFTAATSLTELGADVACVSRSLSSSGTFNELLFQSKVLLKTELFFDGMFGFLSITNEDFIESQVGDYAAEGLAERIRDIKGVEVSVVARQVLDSEGNLIWRVSLRSHSQKYAVSQIAEKFDGGGHVCAAAFKTRQPLESWKKILIKHVEDLIQVA
jgi:bifunctional oligoribonuclease and PAP phosphatase NrnA